MTGVVTRGGKPVGGGRVGGWQKRRKEMNRINAAIHRGRTLPMSGYEFVRTTVNPDGTFALENLKAGPWFGPWFFVYEEPTGPPTIVGPVTITSKDRTMAVDIAVTEGARSRVAWRTCRPRWRARSGSSPSTPRSSGARHSCPPTGRSAWRTCPPGATG